MPYMSVKSVFHCPSEHESKEPSYAMNRRLHNFKTSEIDSPANVVIVFESIPGKNMNGGIGLLPMPPRHNGIYCIGFADGHADFVGKMEPVDLAGLVWNPKKKGTPSHPKLNKDASVKHS